MDRAGLYALVDALPESAIANAMRVLTHLGLPASEIELRRKTHRDRMQQKMHDRMQERMRRSSRPGTVGGIIGGGRFNPSTGYGHSGHTGWEDDTVVHETYHLFKTQEIAVTERLRLTDDGKGIHYRHQATGPKGDSIVSETTFDL
jgi:hypothetical protein